MRIVDFLLIILGLLILFTALSIVVMSLIWLERKVLGRLQRRLGPTRTGPMGLLQPVADAVKLVLKEDLIPSSADRAVFWVAPLVVLVPSFMIWVTVPAAENLVMRNLDMGLLYIIAFSVLTILGLILAGWGSANKYGALGGFRSAAQLVSYEIPIIMVVISVAMLAQSLDLRVVSISQVPYTDVDIVKSNPIDIPFVVLQPLGMIIFLIAGLAEVGRTPFDIYFCRVGDNRGPLRGVQRGPLGGLLPGGVHEHLHHRCPHSHPVPGRMVRAMASRLAVVPYKDLLHRPDHILD